MHYYQRSDHMVLLALFQVHFLFCPAFIPIKLDYGIKLAVTTTHTVKNLCVLLLDDGVEGGSQMFEAHLGTISWWWKPLCFACYVPQ